MAQCNLCFRVAFLAVLLPLTSGACVDFYLGMGSGTIPDSNINASSVQSASTPATNGRLNYTSGSSWCAGTSDKNPYLQIDLQTLHVICAVSTQGNSQADQWVKTYTLQLSTDGITWTNYTELGAQAKVLEGNKDRNSNVKHVLYGVLTRYLRFLPQTHQGEVCMRTEVFGVQQKPTCDSQGIGLASSDRIPDNSFSASSIFAPTYAAKFGRLNGTGAWEPKTKGGDDYLQIDLLYEYVICAVATQGNPPTQSVGAQEWTTEYKLRFSLNGTTFRPYKENKLDKAFPGNSGKTDTVKNSLKEHASAKFIRFLPTKYNVHKALRVEAYGILFTKVPSQPPTAFKLTATSSTSITASWQLPPVFARHGRTITGFKLFYKKKGFGGSATPLPISRGSILSGNVTRLDKYTEYEFQVLAFTSDGDGPKSSVVVERTMEDVPSQAPKSLTLTAGSSTTVTASWQLPPLDSRNGIITGFKLFYKKKTASGSLAMLRIDNGAIHDKTVIGLDKNTEYEFQVLAFTSTGDGPKSSPVVVRTRKDGGCVEFYLGMENGAIPDNKLTASTEQSANTPAKNGRMNYASGSSWCARTSDTNPYLQIDLQTLHIICAVSTQGNSQADQWVKTYTLQLSTDEKVWTDYKELGEQVKVLQGNKDRNSNVKHVLYGVLTRYLRFLPQTHQGEVCMRTEVFGVQQKPTCDLQAIGLASSGRIPDNSFSASSIFASKYAAKFGRLKGKGAWEPKTNDRDDYLQIDLLYEYVICAVATQGNPPTQSPAQEWTTEYKLRFSLNGTTFFLYKENKIDKAFPGNSGKTDTVKNSLKEFASAKFIRFLPTKYNKFKVLRVEAYGILFSKVPSQPPTAFKLTATSSTRIAASWQLPPVFARHGRTITGFKLFYKEKVSGVSMSKLTISGESTLSRNVTGLDKYTEYEFQVLAFTSDGDGPKSSVVVERTLEDVPSQPPSNFMVSATSSTSVRASWQLPAEKSRNGIIKGFKLFYNKRSSSVPGTVISINSESTLNIEVIGLDKYTEYEFQVLAFTSSGDGTNSSVVFKRTKEDVPSKPPSGFNLTASSSTSITASWQLPPEKSRNGIIKGFKLSYQKKGSAGPGLERLITDKTKRIEEVTRLDKYTEYEFKILAFTSVGDGPKSPILTERTKEDAPSQAPTKFSVSASSSTSITASWLLPPVNSRHGIIKGFKLFYKRKGSSDSATSLNIRGGATQSKIVTGLDKYTEYELQVLAFTSAGDGPKSPSQVVRTREDAPDAPTFLSYSDLSPNKSHGPRITLTWSKPQEPNGVIRSYTLFYSHDGVAPKEISGIEKDTLTHTVDVLGGVTYQFNVRAVTIKPGKNATKTVTAKEYAPSVGPDSVSTSQVNKTTFNISWEPLQREESHGKVTLYEVKAIFLKKGNLHKRSVIYSPSVNTSVTFVVLSDLELCSRYNVSVRAYTAEGPGPYGEPLELETSRPEAPGEFKVKESGATQITLAWKQYDDKEKIAYTVKYTGTKSYNKTFRDEKTIKAIKATTQKVEGLIPGTTYEFRVHGTSVCGDSASKVVSKITDMIAPKAPVPHSITDVEVSQTAVDIYLWPVEQKYGPVSAYQVIVLKVADGVEELPNNYDSKLKAASDAEKENVNFYIAAEIENFNKPQKFTVGDGNKTKEFVNEELEKGENYIVYERALTKAKKVELKGNASIVAKISIISTTTEGEKKEKSSGSNAAAVAVPVVLLLLLIPAVVVAVFLYRRRRQSRSKSAGERSVQLDDIKDDSQDLTSSTSNLVYQNVADIRRTIHDAGKQPVSEEEEAIYSEADDGKPKPIPVAEFSKYLKKKSENGAIVLREEFKYLPGGMQFAWEIGKSNRGKNRYGNIVSYDHSRVLLEEIEGDKNSSYINASYIPTYDEVTMTYIATQGPTSTTIADFWRMVWQENSFTIVMLTNLVELGKGKCDQYWPDDTSKFGAITVTLHKTETFADYVIRSLIVTKDSEKRTVQQFHYVTWPDKGVPQHSTALLGFRQKIHARHQATGGPLVVHCSAGVGRTGTYIAIDAMLESAEKIKTVFIQNYVQVMRRSRPHMIQKDDQYVFLHQAVMEALVCGNTEIIPQDLRIATNKLAKVHKPSKKTGYERELKRLELVTDAHASQEVATNAFMPANVVKNRFPNIVPLDNARVHLQASSQEKSYINASYVDDYTQRNAYILTQAPLDCTIIDFWLMISQYDIGTVVMLNNLEEGKQSYPQYWPSEGSAKYGEVTVQLLSQETSNNITTRGFSVDNAAPPKKTSTLQHIQYNGWVNENSCPDPQDILDLMTTVQQSQQQSGNRVIVFQCSDGTGRSGCVATIMSVIERVKTEQTVDVFQTVKLVRAKRPGAVNTLELYMFCYKTVLAYLDSFSTYSNFAEC